MRNLVLGLICEVSCPCVFNYGNYFLLKSSVNIEVIGHCSLRLDKVNHAATKGRPALSLVLDHFSGVMS